MQQLRIVKEKNPAWEDVPRYITSVKVYGGECLLLQADYYTHCTSVYWETQKAQGQLIKTIVDFFVQDNLSLSTDCYVHLEKVGLEERTFSQVIQMSNTHTFSRDCTFLRLNTKKGAVVCEAGPARKQICGIIRGKKIDSVFLKKMFFLTTKKTLPAQVLSSVRD